MHNSSVPSSPKAFLSTVLAAILAVGPFVPLADAQVFSAQPPQLSTVLVKPAPAPAAQSTDRDVQAVRLDPVAARHLADQLRGTTPIGTFLLRFRSVDRFLGLAMTAMAITGAELGQGVAGRSEAMNYLSLAGLPLSPAEYMEQLSLVSRTPGLRLALESALKMGTIGSVVGNPLRVPGHIVVGLGSVNIPQPAPPANGTTTAAGAPDVSMCDEPLVSEGASTSACSSFRIRASFWFPCCKFGWSGCKGCRITVDLGSLSFCAGCELEAKVNCCGGYVRGSCFASACAFGQCAVCNGSISAGIGVTPGSGGMCSYGASLTAGIGCTIGGVSVFGASIPVSPYAFTGPCPPDGFCAQ